jgi:Rrf2 family protein
MAANSRFAVAVHIMMLLARHPEEYLSSERIAKSVNTNPVVVRRLLCKLCAKQLVHCRLGKRGGAALGSDATRISLFDVYQAVEEQGLFAQHARPENPDCEISCKMKKTLAKVFKQCEGALARNLKQTTIAELVRR